MSYAGLSSTILEFKQNTTDLECVIQMDISFNCGLKINEVSYLV
jgi:hypothetical protein